MAKKGDCIRKNGKNGLKKMHTIFSDFFVLKNLERFRTPTHIKIFSLCIL
jgi:hypothetical protein